MNQTKLYEMKDELSRDLTYYQCLLRSYEAQVERVEPLSTDFEDVMTGIFNTQDKIQEIGKKLVGIKYQISVEEEMQKINKR